MMAPKDVKHGGEYQRRLAKYAILDQEDPLEKEMATHSSILAWRNPRTKEPGRLQSMGSQESDMT